MVVGREDRTATAELLVRHSIASSMIAVPFSLVADDATLIFNQHVAPEVGVDSACPGFRVAQPKFTGPCALRLTEQQRRSNHSPSLRL